MFTTLITTADLAARLGDAGPRRRRAPRPRAARRWGEAQYGAGAPPRRAVRAPRPRPVGAEDRPQRPPSAAVAGGLRGGVRPARHRRRHAGRRLRPGQRHVRVAAVVDAALARPRRRRGARRRLRHVGSRRPPGGDGRARRPAPRRSRRGRAVARSMPRSSSREPRRASLLLVDARAPSAFAATSSRSTRSPATSPARPTGRITHNLDPDGTFKPADALRADFARAARRRPLDRGRPPVRLRRHRLPQRAGDGDRRPARHPALPRVLERVGRRSCASGRDGRMSGKLTAGVPIRGGRST